RDARFREVLANWCSTGVAAPWRPRVTGGGHDADAGETLHVGIPGMSTLCRSLSAGVMLITGVGVAGARRAGRTWRLQGEYAADLGGFDAVVVATPPRQAAVFLSQARGLLRRIGGVSMAPCWAVMAAFDRRLELDWDVGSFPEDPVSLAVRNSAKPGRTDTESWVLHASPEWTASHLEAEPDTVAGDLLHEFAQRWVGDELPRRVFVGAHRWRYATATEPLDDGFLWDAATRAGVCADWCRGGGVEDAFLSGLELAQRIAKMG
ncbi:MAG: FAD-dependent oxidoreductase, partial [Gemmatimonadales bacterium]